MRTYRICLDWDREPEPGIETFPAVTPKTVESELHAYGLRWTYPWEGEAEAHGLRLHAYTTRDRLARMGCFLSHFILWRVCRDSGEPLLILEDDAEILGLLETVPEMGTFGAVSINDPRGATRKGNEYHLALARAPDYVTEAPWIDDDRAIPQGLPGNSAYMLKPELAAALIKKTREVGAWPNDALMCKQFFPGLLGCCAGYYTKVSGRPSTLA